MAKKKKKRRHILKVEGRFIDRAYCGKRTLNRKLFLRRAVGGNICQNCIRCRIAYKRKVRL